MANGDAIFADGTSGTDPDAGGTSGVPAWHGAKGNRYKKWLMLDAQEGAANGVYRKTEWANNVTFWVSGIGTGTVRVWGEATPDNVSPAATDENVQIGTNITANGYYEFDGGPVEWTKVEKATAGDSNATTVIMTAYARRR
jgi:hypothetical protein